MSNHLTLCLLSDDQHFRERLEPLASESGIGVQETPDGAAWLKCIEEMKIGCAMIVRQAFHADDLAWVTQLRDRAYGIPLVAISGTDQFVIGFQLAKLGARHALLASTADAEIHAAVKEAVIYSFVTRKERDALADAQRRFAQVGERERVVLEQMIRGVTSAKIARLLNVTPRTIETRRRTIMLTMGCSSVAELVELVLRVRWSPYRDWSRPMPTFSQPTGHWIEHELKASEN